MMNSQKLLLLPNKPQFKSSNPIRMKKIVFTLSLMLLLTSYCLQAQVDLKVHQLNTTQCDTTGYQTMYLRVINQTVVPIATGLAINAMYQVNGTTPVSEVLHLLSPLYPGDSVVLYFTVPYHFNQFTAYNCMYAISATGDLNTLNDTARFTRTFNSLPGYGVHSSDTTICNGSPTTLMMELTGNGPWTISFAMGPDTLSGLAVPDPIISTEMSPDTTSTFTLITVIDANGCTSYIGQSITITVSDIYPVVNLGHDTTMCAGATLLLNAENSGSQFNWWNGPGSQTNSADTSDWNGQLGNQIAWVDVNLAGCITRDSIKINWIICPDGITENQNLAIKTYPNPSRGLVQLNFEQAVEHAQLSVINCLGQQLYIETITQAGNSTKTLDWSSFENGMYFITIAGEGISIRQKVLLHK